MDTESNTENETPSGTTEQEDGESKQQQIATSITVKL